MAKMMMDEAGDGMDSLYGEGDETPAAPENQKPESKEEEAAEGETAIVPMKLLQGSHPEPIKEGEEIVVKAVKVYGDEVEIAYSNAKPGSIGGEKTPEQEIDELDNPGTY